MISNGKKNNPQTSILSDQPNLVTKAKTPILEISEIVDEMSEITKMKIEKPTLSSFFSDFYSEGQKLFPLLYEKFQNKINSNEKNDSLFEQHKVMTFPKNFLENYKNLKFSQIKFENLEDKNEKISHLVKQIKELYKIIEDVYKINEIHSVEGGIIGENGDETYVIIRINNNVYLCQFIVKI